MSARRGMVEEDTEELDGGPGLAYMPFVVMDDLLDKLKLLGYDKDFLIELKMKPLNRCVVVVVMLWGEWCEG